MISQEEFIKIIKEQNINVKIILEVGALDGKDARKLGDVFPGSRVIAVEGNPCNYIKYRRENKNIEWYFCVVGEDFAVKKFHLKEYPDIGGLRDRGQKYGSDSFQAICLTLDMLIYVLDIEKIDVFKLDVEGCAFEVLSGCDLSKIKIIFLETEEYPFFEGQYLDDEVSELLVKNGFILLKSVSQKILGTQSNQVDSIWIRN